jgi:hypothetical protein
MLPVRRGPDCQAKGVLEHSGEDQIKEDRSKQRGFDIGRVQSCVLRLPKYSIDPPLPSPPGECVLPPTTKAGGTHSPGGEGGGGSIFWKTKDIGLASYSNNLSTDPSNLELEKTESFRFRASNNFALPVLPVYSAIVNVLI